MLLYPFAVYLGLNYFSPSVLAAILIVILLARLLLMRDVLSKMPWLIPASVLGCAALFMTMISGSFVGVKLYPVMVNLALLAVFAYSYLKPPTVIESFARIKQESLPDFAVRYTAKVTLAWCVFFIVNGSIALYTAFLSTLEVWTFYNGFLSYICMVSLMLIEFCIRIKVKKSNEQPVYDSQGTSINDWA